MDEISPEFLKVLDAVGRSWLILQHCVDVGGTVPLDCQIVVVSFTKRNQRGCSNCKSMTLDWVVAKANQVDG